MGTVYRCASRPSVHSSARSITRCCLNLLPRLRAKQLAHLYLPRMQNPLTIICAPSSELADLAPSTAGPRATRATGVDKRAFLPVNLDKSAAFFFAEVVKYFEGLVDEAANFEVEPRRRGVERREMARDMVVFRGYEKGCKGERVRISITTEMILAGRFTGNAAEVACPSRSVQ